MQALVLEALRSTNREVSGDPEAASETDGKALLEREVDRVVVYQGRVQI
jgi:hypothetical protein